jgi:hypothetical protein
MVMMMRWSGDMLGGEGGDGGAYSDGAVVMPMLSE